MGYVIVDQKTRCKVAFPTTRRETWSTEAAAKAAMTRLVSKDMEKYLKTEGQSGRRSYEVMSSAAYAAQVPMKTVKNMMTGKDVQIRADTPNCCDPSSETYWSM